MKAVQIVLLIALCLSLPGCLSATVDGSGLEVDGLLNAYLTADAWPRYDHTLLRLGILGHNTRHEELITLEIWPLLGIGVGFVGARVRVLPIELGIGTLFYDPEPRIYHDHDDDDDCDECDGCDDCCEDRDVRVIVIEDDDDRY